MSYLKEAWVKKHNEVRERQKMEEVSPFELARAREMLERLEQGLVHNIEDHLVLTRPGESGKYWHLIVDFSDPAEKTFGKNIRRDLKKAINNKKQRGRIPGLLDMYSRFGSCG